MRAGNDFCGTYLIEALNEDIERELRIADEHIARALSAHSFRKGAAVSNSATRGPCATQPDMIAAAAASASASPIQGRITGIVTVPPRAAPPPQQARRS